MHSDIQKTQPDWCQPWHHEPQATGNGVATCLLRSLWMVPFVQINTSIKLTDGDHPHSYKQASPQFHGKTFFWFRLSLQNTWDLATWDFGLDGGRHQSSDSLWISIEVAKWETTVLQAHNAFDGSDRRKAEACWSQQPTMSSHSASAASVLTKSTLIKSLLCF